MLKKNVSRVCLSVLCTLAIGLIHQAGCSQTSAAQSQPSSAASSRSAATGPAKLTLNQAYLDVGVLEGDSTKEVKMPIRNDGDKPLTISRVRTDCKCFIPSLQKDTLAPGESANVMVKVLTLKHRGELGERIVLASNDPAGLKAFAVRFEVPKDLTTDPERLYLGILSPGQELHKTIKVIANADIKTKIPYAISGSDWLVGRPVQPELAKDKPATIDVVVKAPAATGLYRNELNITTGEPRFPSVTLPVVVSVCKSATVAPDAVDFGKFAGQAGRELSLTLAKDCSLKAATAKPDVLAIQVEPADAQGNTKVKLTIKPDAPFGPFHGELLLQLDGPEKAEIAVPFAGYRESPPAF